jgi:hypothetical protein
MIMDRFTALICEQAEQRGERVLDHADAWLIRAPWGLRSYRGVLSLTNLRLSYAVRARQVWSYWREVPANLEDVALTNIASVTFLPTMHWPATLIPRGEGLELITLDRRRIYFRLDQARSWKDALDRRMAA